MKTKLMLISLAAIMLLPVALSACGQNTGIKSVWVIDPNNNFHTNNLQRAQKEIPFTIIIPKYVPEIMGSDYSFQIDGPIQDLSLKKVDVEISYIKETHIIFISEIDVENVMMPNPEMEPVYRDIAGIKVLQQQSFLYGESKSTEGLRFDWNQDGLTYAVRIFSISEDDGIKIVESMITQMK